MRLRHASDYHIDYFHADVKDPFADPDNAQSETTVVLDSKVSSVQPIEIIIDDHVMCLASHQWLPSTTTLHLRSQKADMRPFALYTAKGRQCSPDQTNP